MTSTLVVKKGDSWREGANRNFPALYSTKLSEDPKMKRIMRKQFKNNT